jgi:phosphonopyruvate decarboxylase
MLDPGVFLEAARERGVPLWSGVPCSYLQGLINRTIDHPALRYVPAANEGEAVAIAAGVELGGGRAGAMFQNSGLGNAVSPLTSLAFTHRIPVLLVVTLRGEPGGPADEPQHDLMGSITVPLLDLIGVRWEYFPDRSDAVGACLDRAVAHMMAAHLPYALLMRKGMVATIPAPPVLPFTASTAAASVDSRPARATRVEMLAAIQAASAHRDVIVSTTGHTSRALWALGDRPNQLYLVGAMGCASSVGLGLALERPDLRIVVIDGDGAAIMRLGALATIGGARPSNLVHVLLDNGLHESTGGQSTAARWTDLAAVAAACGYPNVVTVTDPSALADLVRQPSSGLTFVHARIAPGHVGSLPRPTVAPHELTERFRHHVRGLTGEPA